jgi:raffinose/stachyose/melibiose transport system permease protein
MRSLEMPIRAEGKLVFFQAKTVSRGTNTMTSQPKRKTNQKFPYHILVFLAPAVLIYTAFMIFPMFDSLRLSLFSSDANNIVHWVGLQNYRELLTDPTLSNRLWGALKNNLVFFVIHMCVQNPVGLLLAYFLSLKIRGSVVYRTLIFTPTVLSVVIVGFAWKLILSPLWGISSNVPILNLMNLGVENSALISLSLISVWQYVGIPMMLFLASIIRIPEEFLEAARVDGANAWTVFWKIQFPLLLPTAGIVGVLTFVGNFNAFDLVYSAQGALAGPSFSTDLLGTFFYRTFFGFQLQGGDPFLGSAVAGVMLVIILIGVLIYLFGFQRRIENVEL